MDDRRLRRLRDASIIGSLGGQAVALGLWAIVQIAAAIIIVPIFAVILAVMFYYMIGPVGVGLMGLFVLGVIYFMIKNRLHPESPRTRSVSDDDEPIEEEGPTVNLPPPGRV